MPPKYQPSNDTPRGENMPGYHSNNIYNIFNDEVSSLPDTIGSVDDTRAGEVSQLHDNDTSVEIVDVATVNETLASVFNKKEFSYPSPEKQIFQVIIPVSIPSSTALPFKAASIRVDNLTNQWIFIPSLRIYIPPDFFGTILSANAMAQLTVVFEAPPGLVNPAPTAGTIVNVIAHKEPLIDVPGTRRL